MIGSNIPIQEKQKEMSLWKKASFVIRRLYNKLLCFVGLHVMVLQSGLPGTPKYWCRRCEKLSKELW